MIKKIQKLRIGLYLISLTVTSCDFPRLSELVDGGGAKGGGGVDGAGSVDGAANDGRPFSLELLAGDIGGPGNADGTGAAARFSFPSGVAVDGAGNVYVADGLNHTIRKVTAMGVVTTLAGTYDVPAGVAVDSAGNVYIAGLNSISKVTAAGVVTTLAGAGISGSADGTGATARFNSPEGVAVDSAGNIYVADRDNSTIRKVSAAGVVTTLAGAAGMVGSADGTGAAARFSHPYHVAVDSADNIYVADYENHTIRKVTASGVVTTLAGTAGMAGSVDGTGAAARFDHPAGIAVDSAGNVYVADQFNSTIRKMTAAGVVTTLAGAAGPQGSTDGTGAAARFDNPVDVAVDSAGNVYVADDQNSTIRKVTADGIVTTLAGAVAMGGLYAAGVAVDSADNVYVASATTIRKVTADGVITTLAGTAGTSGSADGTGGAARFLFASGVAVDGIGNIYVADSGNDTIRKVTAGGVVTTPAGIAGMVGSADGTGAAARFNYPVDAAVDSAGNVYVADQDNSTIRKITPAGVVTTLAGTAGTYGNADGTGSAASFSNPTGVAVDSAGNVYVADYNNSIIRKVTAAGVVTTLAGTANANGSADGTGAAARFSQPAGVAVDSAGNVYVADYNNSVIRKVTPAGITTTVAGMAHVAGILLGTTPRFAFPRSLAIVGDSIVVSDTYAVLLLRHGAQ